jgi:hypothetical protein
MLYKSRHEGFSLFETSKGTVYLLNTTSGETKIIYSTELLPKLVKSNIYETDDGKTYKYMGGGKLMDLTVIDTADKFLEKNNLK